MDRTPRRLFATPGPAGQGWNADDFVAIHDALSRPLRHTIGAVLVLGVAAGAGLTLGSQPSPANFSWLYGLATLGVPFTVGPAVRLLLTIGIVGAGAFGYTVAGPPSASVIDYGPQFGFLLATGAISVFLGAAVHELRATTVVQRRRLDESRQQLASVNDALQTRISEQRAELRALAFHLSSVTAAEQRGLRGELRGDLIPEIDRLASAVRGLGSDGPREAISGLDDCDRAMQRAHLVFRHVLRRLHPNAVERMGLTAALHSSMENVGRRNGATVSVRVDPLPEDTDVRVREMIHSGVRDGLRRWEIGGVFESVALTVQHTEDAIDVELRGEGDFEPERGVSVVLVGLRERCAALGGTVEDESVGREHVLRLSVPVHPSPVQSGGLSVGTDTVVVEETDDVEGLREYVREFEGANAVRYTGVLSTLLLVWWPFDSVIIDDPALVVAMGKFRAACLIILAIPLLTRPGRRAIVNHPLIMGLILLFTSLFMAGWVLGPAGTVATGWAHYLAYAPVLTLVFVEPIRIRLTMCLTVSAAGMSGFFGANPAELTSPDLPGLVLFTACSILVHAGVGGLLYQRVRTGYRLGRRLEAQRQHLRAVRRDLAELVRLQTSELRQRAVALQGARAEERAWMVHEMHDGLGQIVASLGYTLGRLKRTSRGGVVDSTSAVLAEAVVMVDRLQDELRRILARLGPRQMERGLGEALSKLMATVAPTGELVTELEVDVREDELHPDHGLLVYRVVQEGLSNILKHARASRVRVAVRREERGLRVEVIDDGVGLPLDLADEGLGLPGITRRVAGAGGEVKWTQARHGGTRLSAFLPTGEEAG